ncbi:hypothetical protein [Roseivivax sp. THAF30]|uniref:hypothetical protein n=1 Tax=Roseivivax sp. THAF30 TaxID=2587852 RepID=UPI001267C4EE|nr:hypothetical protein [Roseivivax sp. THAF30]QFT61803.1 hypothetical protein FIU91_02585 [Roseivivax sp. THAF30]
MNTRQPRPKNTPSVSTYRRDVVDTQRIIDDREASIREQIRAGIQSGKFGPEGSLSRKRCEEEIAMIEAGLHAAHTKFLDNLNTLIDIAEETSGSHEA